MDRDFARRSGEVRVTWGSLGPATLVTRWARELGAPGHSLRNLENGFRPKKGLSALEARYEPLREKGGDPKRLAAWVWTGEGSMQRPAGRLPADLDDAADPRGLTVLAGGNGNGKVIELIEEGLGKAIDAESRGQRVGEMLESMRRIVRDARKLGLAVVFGFAMIGAPSRSHAEVAELADALDSGSRTGKKKCRPRVGKAARCIYKFPSSAFKRNDHIARVDDRHQRRPSVERSA